MAKNEAPPPYEGAPQPPQAVYGGGSNYYGQGQPQNYQQNQQAYYQPGPQMGYYNQQQDPYGPGQGPYAGQGQYPPQGYYGRPQGQYPQRRDDGCCGSLLGGLALGTACCCCLDMLCLF